MSNVTGLNGKVSHKNFSELLDIFTNTKVRQIYNLYTFDKSHLKKRDVKIEEPYFLF